MSNINNEQINDNSHNTKEKEKNKKILFIVLKKHKLGILLVLFLMLVSSTMAWFIYNKTVDMGLQTHVKSWNVSLGDGEEGTYEFKISDLYPGMDNATDSVDVVNSGELNSSVNIEVKSITLFGELQVEDVDYTVLITDNGTKFTINGYPFKLGFTLGTSTINAGGKSSLSFELVWDYENDEAECMVTENDITYNKCDREDTILGEKSYEFSNNPDNKDKSSLVIELKMNFVQDTNP